MRILSVILLCSLISSIPTRGQTGNKESAKVDNLFANDRFAVALPYYLKLFRKDSSDIDLNYKIGVCYVNSRSQKVKAIRFLKKACSSSLSPEVNKYLGDAYHLANRFDLAISSYEKFKGSVLNAKPENQSILDELNWKIDLCRFGEKLLELDSLQKNIKANNYHDKNATKNTNFNYSEYTSSFSLDQSSMTFTFQRPDPMKQNIPADAKYFEDISIPVKSDSSFTVTIDTSTIKNETTVATSVDGQIVLTYKDDNGNGNLYITRLIGNQWKTSEEINKEINTKGWEQDEYISADGYVLYFTSDRAGGYGGKDIYSCKKLLNGEWGKAVNLGPTINTLADEEAPFLYSDGETLYFSSNKYKQACCFDIFSSTMLNDGSWSTPVKVGFPVKTRSDDFLYAKIADQDRERDPLFHPEEIESDKDDLYLVTFTDQKETPFTILKGKVKDTNGKILGSVKIIVTDNETGEILGIYNSNYGSGEYLLPLPAGRNNNISFESEGYLFQSVNKDINKKNKYFELQEEIALPFIASGSIVVLNNVFFDADKNTLRSLSNIELSKVFLLLSNNPNMIVELSYSCNIKDNNKLRSKIAQERSKAVADYLTEKGISKERISIKEYGKARSKNTKVNSDRTAHEQEELDKLELKLITVN